ncbi:DUF4336 domain-containing protein [Lusitaniella coriacea]|uniref:DUF4336 domain-containing protein n=1 Tax=Lusitaniella coriacea TaxID=1983105 RepID=UPI003CF506B9
MATEKTQVQRIPSKDWNWSFWPLVPLYPYNKRRTLRVEVLQDTLWTFEQLQGILYVTVPIRMSVLRLEAGGLLVYCPVAPTPECIRLVRELEVQHGNVKYIILPTISGLEHKVFVGPFARHFPEAQVFVAPNQWSFPLNLPLSWLGFPANRTHILPEDSSKTPFAEEFDYAILGPVELGPGRFEEVVFFHARSRTLLLTDTIVSIPKDPPPILNLNPYPLLFHARDSALDPIEDTPANRQKGWQRISLFAFYFQPSALEAIPWGQTFRNAAKAPNRSKKAYFGLFPFQWQKNWKSAFNALRDDGRLLVAPVLQALILNRAPKETLNWVEKVTCWNFQRIIPAHFDSPLNANPQEFQQAFNFLKKLYPPILPEADFATLREIDTQLLRLGIVPPAQDKV